MAPSKIVWQKNALLPGRAGKKGREFFGFRTNLPYTTPSCKVLKYWRSFVILSFSPCLPNHLHYERCARCAEPQDTWFGILLIFYIPSAKLILLSLRINTVEFNNRWLKTKSFMKAITNEIGNFSFQVAESLFNQAQSLTFNFLKFSLGLIPDTPSLDLPSIQLCLSHYPHALLGTFL